MNEDQLQIFIYGNNKVKEFKKQIATLLSEESVLERVKDKKLTGASKYSFKDNDDWVVLGLLYFADEKKFKDYSAAIEGNPKLSTKFKYDYKKEDKSPDPIPYYDIISNTVKGEAKKGTQVNVLYPTYADALSEGKQEANPLAEKWYEQSKNYLKYCGPSSRGAKACYAYQKLIEENKSITSFHPLMPVFAVMSLCTGTYGHHSYFEILSGTIGVYEKLTLENCDINWLKVLGTYSKGFDVYKDELPNTDHNNELMKLIAEQLK